MGVGVGLWVCHVWVCHVWVCVCVRMCGWVWECGCEWSVGVDAGVCVCGYVGVCVCEDVGVGVRVWVWWGGCGWWGVWVVAGSGCAARGHTFRAPRAGERGAPALSARSRGTNATTTGVGMDADDAALR